MSANKGLSSRAIIGSFYRALAQDAGGAWIGDVGMKFNSNQESETYKWLGQTPAMREWIGGRNAKGFRENGITIVNKKYEATLEVPVDWLRRDKTGQLNVRINELARRTNAHWASLLTTLIVNGESTVCYDGQNFFDTDHSEGDSGSQNNDLTHAAATGTVPTVTEMVDSIQEAIAAIVGFKDDQGEPMNEGASQFLIMAPTALLATARSAVGSAYLANGVSNTLLAQPDWNVRVIGNARLTNTDRYYIFRTDSDVKPFILQEEEGVTVSAIAEGTELEFNEDVHHYGVKAIRNVGYGYWQDACLMTFT
jgi:phage major head subunit gpT-like protein